MMLFLVIFCLVLNGGLGAPSTAVYKFVKCSPDGDQANCITHKSEEMEWSPDLPTKLPASAAQNLVAEPVEDERAPSEEEEEEDVMEDEESHLTFEEEESPPVYLPMEGSGYEGSGFMADGATPADAGSGDFLSENYKPNKGGRKNRKGAFLTKSSLFDEQKPAAQEMKEDRLL